MKGRCSFNTFVLYILFRYVISSSLLKSCSPLYWPSRCWRNVVPDVWGNTLSIRTFYTGQLLFPSFTSSLFLLCQFYWSPCSIKHRAVCLTATSLAVAATLCRLLSASIWCHTLRTELRRVPQFDPYFRRYNLPKALCLYNVDHLCVIQCPQLCRSVKNNATDKAPWIFRRDIGRLILRLHCIIKWMNNGTN